MIHTTMTCDGCGHPIASGKPPVQLACSIGPAEVHACSLECAAKAIHGGADKAIDAIREQIARPKTTEATVTFEVDITWRKPAT